jgi:hypothetical protein
LTRHIGKQARAEQPLHRLVDIVAGEGLAGRDGQIVCESSRVDALIAANVDPAHDSGLRFACTADTTELNNERRTWHEPRPRQSHRRSGAQKPSRLPSSGYLNLFLEVPTARNPDVSVISATVIAGFSLQARLPG